MTCQLFGTALQDVLQFSHGADAALKKRKRQDGSTEYTVVARHNPLTGRIEAETGDDDAGPDDALYKECVSWCNPVEYEKYLQQVYCALIDSLWHNGIVCAVSNHYNRDSKHVLHDSGRQTDILLNAVQY